MIKLNSFTNFDNFVFKPDGLVGLDQEALATDFMGILSGYTPDQQSLISRAILSFSANQVFSEVSPSIK